MGVLTGAAMALAATGTGRGNGGWIARCDVAVAGVYFGWGVRPGLTGLVCPCGADCCLGAYAVESCWEVGGVAVRVCGVCCRITRCLLP